MGRSISHPSGIEEQLLEKQELLVTAVPIPHYQQNKVQWSMRDVLRDVSRAVQSALKETNQ